jgi:hypothetical protein
VAKEKINEVNEKLLRERTKEKIIPAWKRKNNINLIIVFQ